MTIQQLHEENRIIRGKWSDTDEQGRQLLCLYTALANDPDARPSDCPADLCPRWLAHLLPWMDDCGSAEAWPRMVARVVALAPRLAEVPPEVEYRVRALCVREAMQHADDKDALAACERVTNLCERAGRGDMGSPDAWGEAASAARRAASAAWSAAKSAASAAEIVVDRLTDAILAEIEGAI